MIYLLCNPAVADDLNRSFMRLILPEHLRPSDFRTEFYTTRMDHPATGYSALGIPEEQKVLVHQDVTGAELIYLLGIFVADGAMTQEEADVVTSQIADSAGQEISILEFIPESWSDFVLTKEEMEQQGWFMEYEELV